VDNGSVSGAGGAPDWYLNEPACSGGVGSVPHDLKTALSDLFLSRAECEVDPLHDSKPLMLTRFGFTIPEEANVTGIWVRMRAASGGASLPIHDRFVQLLSDGGIVGSNQAGTDPWEISATQTNCDAGAEWRFYGGNHHSWGDVSFTPQLINADSFGIQLVARNANTKTGNPGSSAYVDIIQVLVYFCD